MRQEGCIFKKRKTPNSHPHAYFVKTSVKPAGCIKTSFKNKKPEIILFPSGLYRRYRNFTCSKQTKLNASVLADCHRRCGLTPRLK